MEKLKEYLKGKLPNSQFTLYDDYTVLQLIWKIIIPTLNNFIDEFKTKTDLYGDHKGSWQGLDKPTLSEEGMRATVEKLVKVVDSIEYNITSYGCKCDGITDDTKNFAAALLDISKKGGGTLKVPKGTTIISDTLSLPKNINLVGDGEGNTIIKMVSNDKDMFTSIYDVYTDVNIFVKDLTLTTNREKVTGIKSILSARFKIENVSFTGLTRNVYFDRGRYIQLENITVSGSLSYPCGYSTFTSTIPTSYIFDIQINDYFINNIGNGCYGGKPSIELINAVGSFINNYHSNDLGGYQEVNFNEGIAILGDSQGIKIDTSIIVAPKNYGIRIDELNGKYPIAVTITNTDVDQVKIGNGIEVLKGYWFNISNCSLTDVKRNGVIVNANNSNVYDNTIVNAEETGLIIGSGTNGIKVNNNYIERSFNGILLNSSINNYLVTNNTLFNLVTNKIVNNSKLGGFVNNNLGVAEEINIHNTLRGSTIITLKSNDTSATITYDPLKFRNEKPSYGALFSAMQGFNIIGYYDFDRSTPGNAIFNLSGNIPTGSVRFNFDLGN